METTRFVEKGALGISGARMLLVEDDEVLRELILLNLRTRGHEVCFAADARTALAQLKATSFDLIFLDINLPDQTRWAAAGGGAFSGTGWSTPTARISAAGLPAQALPNGGYPPSGC